MTLDDFPGGTGGAAVAALAVVAVVVLSKRGGVSTSSVVSLPQQSGIDTAAQSSLSSEFNTLANYAERVDVTRITGATQTDQLRIRANAETAIASAREAAATERQRIISNASTSIANTNAQANKNIERAKDNTSIVTQVVGGAIKAVGHFFGF